MALPFALDGVVYEIDLNRVHAARLRVVLKLYVNKAPSVAPARAGRRGFATGTQREQQRRRRANQDATSQIRQAAERSREQAKARQQAGATTPTAHEHQQPATPSTFVESRAEPAPARAERTQHAEPPVPLPQFFSAP